METECGRQANERARICGEGAVDKANYEFTMDLLVVYVGGWSAEDGLAGPDVQIPPSVFHSITQTES
jgi:hypothetical protein